MANPPYGVTWRKDQEKIVEESHNPEGRFYAGLPRTSDGQLLFVQHMLSKMKPEGSRVGVVTNGSPLFSGNAGSGESNIRKWIIENDWLECIIALPKDLFYNTGIATYLWFFTNKKSEKRRGKVQLINAVDFCKPCSKSLGNKRNDILEEHVQKVLSIYLNFEENEYSKIFHNKDFGQYELTIEQPQRDDDGNLVLNRSGKKQADAAKRDTEKVSLDCDWKSISRRRCCRISTPSRGWNSRRRASSMRLTSPNISTYSSSKRHLPILPHALCIVSRLWQR